MEVGKTKLLAYVYNQMNGGESYPHIWVQQERSLHISGEGEAIYRILGDCEKDSLPEANYIANRGQAIQRAYSN